VRAPHDLTLTEEPSILPTVASQVDPARTPHRCRMECLSAYGTAMRRCSYDAGHVSFDACREPPDRAFRLDATVRPRDIRSEVDQHPWSTRGRVQEGHQGSRWYG
jgi:hypothetical protein